MNTNKVVFAEELKRIAERLDTCPQVRRYDQNEEKQAWSVAHDLVDLAESFRTYLDDLLPRLKNEDLSPDEMNWVLLDIGEEFRHVLYHIHNSEYYAYLRDEIDPPS
jgi:hypothetical protein